MPVPNDKRVGGSEIGAMGAEFVVVITGNIMRMPVWRVPATEAIGVNDNGHIVGMF